MKKNQNNTKKQISTGNGYHLRVRTHTLILNHSLDSHNSQLPSQTPSLQLINKYTKKHPQKISTKIQKIRKIIKPIRTNTTKYQQIRPNTNKYKKYQQIRTNTQNNQKIQKIRKIITKIQKIPKLIQIRTITQNNHKIQTNTNKYEK
jgi:hypothetical protein